MLGFPFGHGLSYTSFEYSNIQVDSGSRVVSFDLQNTGSVAGDEVAQLYLGFPETAGEPPIQLKGFEKVFLQPNAKTTVKMALTPRDLSVWDVVRREFAVVQGEFAVAVGASSRDLRLKATLKV